MPSRPSTALAAALLAAIVTACAHPAMDDMPEDTLPPERPNETQPGARPPVPDRNAQAVPYEVTLRIENAPGPFAVVVAGMDYDVADSRCLPRLGGMSGTRVQATQSIPVELKQTGPGIYRGVVYDSLFVDEDYYGLGMCRWKLEGVGFGLRATGAEGETRFGEYLTAADLVDTRRTRTYFTALRYPRATMADFRDFGSRDPARFRPEFRDKLWSLEFEVRKVHR